MSIDTAVNSFFGSIQTPFLTYISKAIHYIFEPIILIIVALIISAFLFFKNKKRQAIFLSSTILITAVVVKILKELFSRIRPPNLLGELTNSFPSGHTALAWVFFGAITFIFFRHNKKVAISSLILILAIATSRLYLQVHWLTDVIASLIIGILIFSPAIKYYKKTEKKSK